MARHRRTPNGRSDAPRRGEAAPAGRPAWRSTRALLTFALPAIAGAAGDLWSKHAAFAALPDTPGHSRTLVDGLLWLTRSTNPGIVFGIDWLPRWTVLLATAGALALMVVIFAGSDRRQWLVHVACGMVVGGAAGNAYDRLRTGSVRDFIDVRIPIVDYHWPTFNVADALLVVGLVVIVLAMWRRGRRADRP